MGRKQQTENAQLLHEPKHLRTIKALPKRVLCVQVFRAQELRHPAAGGAAALSSGSFIANDVSLGDDQPPFMLLTGPNMGGKSTMLRQVGMLGHPCCCFSLPVCSATLVG